ncbi:hypothetical protein [Promicromonospora sp. NPDC023805]|uniref:hypothetical protein n=1 Tax=Promicromonospora sp. NPDC023805 TaxID=3154696 RepID=UPI0033FA5CA0
MTTLANRALPDTALTIVVTWVPSGSPTTVERSAESLRAAVQARGIEPVDDVVDTGRVLALGPLLRRVLQHGATRVLLGVGGGPVIGNPAWHGMQRVFAARAGATVEFIRL